MPATNTEQLLIELVNRARLDPLAEAERYDIDLNEDLSPGQLDGLPVQPLSGNELLLAAANAHSTWMLDNNTFSHTGVDGSNAGARASSAGYVFTGSWSWGENIAFTGNTQSVNSVAAIYTHHEGLFLSSGHRLNILNGAFRELGAGQQLGDYTPGPITYQASMVSQTFAISGSAYYLTGVVYDENSGDDFYSAGEGRAGVTFRIGASSASSQAAGGYSLAYSGGAGDVTVTVTIGAATSTATLGFQAQNFKLDVVDGDTFLSSGDITLETGISNVRLLGVVAALATGTGAANILTGNRGDNTLTGMGGNDTLIGGDGTDTVVFGVASTEASFAQVSGGLEITSAEGVDFVSDDVENIQFSNTTLTLAEAQALAQNLTGLNLTGTPGNDILTGGTGDDALTGLDGNDTLRGGDGNDTLTGGAGDDFIFGGETSGDLRDVIYGGDGHDSIDGGYGNDELRGDAGNDSIEGGFGADTVIGGAGDDVLTGSAWSDLVFGGDGNDFINGGFGHDRVNGGAGADRFYHLGVFNHGSDWIQDYDAAEGDVLLWGGVAATAANFQINTADTADAGADGVSESFIIYRPTGQIMWALVDGDAQSSINIQIGGDVFDLLI